MADRNPNLLVGILFDADDNRLTASHATKGDRRYRYYQHPAAMKLAPGKRIRMPAGEMERLILERLKMLLRSPKEVIRIFTPIDASPDALERLTKSAARRAADLESVDG